MHPNTKSTLLAAIGFSLSTAMSFAASVAPLPPPPPPPPPPPIVVIPDPGTPPPPAGGCTATCTPTSPGDPFVPYDPPHHDSAVAFDPHGKSKAEVAKYLGCGDKLAQLGVVRKDTVAAVAAPQAVRVVPVCQYVSLVAEDPFVLLHNIGNANGLERTIAANTLAVGALDGGGYRAGDVVGLTFGDGRKTLILYVHKP